MTSKLFQCSVISLQPAWQCFYVEDESQLKQLMDIWNFKMIDSFEIKFPIRFESEEDINQRAKANHLNAVEMAEDYEIREYGVTIAKYYYMYPNWKERTTNKKLWYYILDRDLTSWISWRSMEHKKALSLIKKQDAANDTISWKRV